MVRQPSDLDTECISFPPPDRFMAQLELDYADGTHETVVTDGSWRAEESPIIQSDIYGGELYDSRAGTGGMGQARL